ncbi:MAG: glycosyltransferase [Erysipelothrix sp.]|nr:glycosyltransferase [Erysipelothrix sp.]
MNRFIKGLVTIIMPVYNTEQYLEKSITSVLNQTYSNFELFLIDDGSTDNSLSICRMYENRDKRIKVLWQQNYGPASARNLALDNMSGEYISFVDSDDWISPQMIYELVSALESFSCDISVCAIASFNGIRLVEGKHYSSTKLFSTADTIKEYLTKPTLHSGPCNKVYRRCVFNDIRFPNVRSKEDAFIMHRLLSKSRQTVYLPLSLYTQFVRMGSLENREFDESKLLVVDSAKCLLDFIITEFPYLEVYAYIKYAGDLTYVLSLMIQDFSKRRFCKEYNSILNELKRTIYKLKTVSNNPLKELSQLEQPINFPYIFFTRNIFKGILKRIKRKYLYLILQKKR